MAKPRKKQENKKLGIPLRSQALKRFGENEQGVKKRPKMEKKFGRCAGLGV